MLLLRDRHWSPSIIMAGFGMPQPPINPANPNNDSIVPNPPADSISSLTFSPNSSLLVAGSWDNKLSCYEVSQNMGQLAAVPRAQAQHDGPVLCTAFSADSAHVFSGGCDKVRARFFKNDEITQNRIREGGETSRSSGSIHQGSIATLRRATTARRAGARRRQTVRMWTLGQVHVGIVGLLSFSSSVVVTRGRNAVVARIGDVDRTFRAGGELVGKPGNALGVWVQLNSRARSESRGRRGRLS